MNKTSGNRLKSGRLASFYKNNPDFDLTSFDLHDPKAIDRLRWDEESKADILDLLKSYQRLFKLYPDERTADALLAHGFTSAYQIAQLPEQRFVSEVGPDLTAADGGSDGARLALFIHRRARAVQSDTMLLALTAQTVSQAVEIPGLTHLEDLIPFQKGMPSYERLFGRNIHAVDKDAQTIFSPAAYFVDLMNLIDQHITQANSETIPAGLTLQERRPDLWQIKLDADSTYTELPYIEIVNQILEAKLRYDLGEDPRKYSANAVYPFGLPANLPLEEVRAYLSPFKLTLAGVYQAFRVAELQAARESLGLSLESYGLITGSPSVLPDGTTPTVADAYGLYESETTDDLSYQKLFLAKTGLTSDQLNDLIYQNMRTTSSTTTCLSFDGSDDYVTCSNSASLQVTGDQTIEMWLKASSWGTTSIFWKAADGEFAVEENGSGILYYMFGPTGDTGSSAAGQTLELSPNKAPLNEWFHLAIVRDWQNKSVTGYINGEAQITSAITVAEIATSGENVQIASGYWSKYHGEMAEVRLWNIARSQEEIQADMNRRLTGREQGLAAYWPLDDGSGTTAKDLSPNNNTGTLHGNPTWTLSNDLDLRRNELHPALMHGLFINTVLPDNQYLCLMPGRIQVTDGAATQSAPDSNTLNRLQSFIRLAGQLGWSYADLDWSLCSLDAISVDAAAMEAIALIKKLQGQLQQPLDVLCSLWADMKTMGLGTQPGPPQDLFDRVFNLPDAFYNPGGHPLSLPYRPLYSGNPIYYDPVQSWNVDSTSSDPTYATDTQFRSRLMAALQLNDGELTALAHYLCDRDLLLAVDLNGAAQDASQYIIALTVQNLTRLYRYSKLAQLLKLSMSDFLTLLPLVGQPAINTVQDVQNICEWASWLKRAGLTVPRLSYITAGGPTQPTNQATADRAVESMLNKLAASAQAVMVTPAALMTDGMSQAQAQTLFDNLVSEGFINRRGLVLHERPLSYQALAALAPWNTDAVAPAVLTPQGMSSDQTLPEQLADEKAVAHVEAVLRAYLARQNDLVVKALANGFRATAGQAESAALLAELMQPSGLTFDGTDDYSEVSYSSALNPAMFTLSCWVKVAEQTAQYQSVVTSRQGGSAGGYMIYVTPTANSGQGFAFWVGDGSGWAQLTDYTPIAFNQWVHIAVTYDGANSSLYLNGKLSAGPFSCSFTLNTQYPLRIGTGCTEGNPNLFFAGEISDMRLWNTVLTAAQIQAEMYSREPQNSGGLAAWWPINAGSGSTLYDWSLNGHDGPLYEYANGTRSEASAPDWHNYHLNRLLEPAPPGEALPQSARDFLALAAQNLVLIKALNLTSYEVASLVENPAPFGISGIGHGFAFTPQQVRTIWEFKQLCKAFNDTSNQLLAYFADPSNSALAQITGWNQDQVATLEAYLSGLATQPVTNFDSVAGVAALRRCFNVSLTLGVSIDYVLNTLLPLSDLEVLPGAGVDNWTLYETTAASVKQVLMKHYQSDLLRAALASILGPLQERLRDRLSQLLIWELGETFARIKTEQDLYEFLLTDVETSSVVQISYLKEGLNALQLYVQRCQTNLENGVADTIPRAWWAWMDSYRVWQANREVYLYPENYVDPTLRKLQTAQFKNFSTQLMQGQLTEKLLAQSYADYMDSAQDLANLRIIESYALDLEQVLPGAGQQQGNQKLLYLFGCTRTDPPTFYIRTALINEAEPSIPAWTPWEQINLNINAEHITPVYAFNRLFLFWVEQAKQTVNVDPLDSSEGSITVTMAAIKYSFRKMGWGWVQPQTLREKIVINIDPLTSYQQSACPTVSFDPNSLSWNKVVAMTIPASGNTQDEELLITYGPLMDSFHAQLQSPEKTSNPFIDAFNEMIYQALQTGYENAGQYVPVGPSMILAGNLARRATQLAVSSNNTSIWSGYVDRASAGASQLKYMKLDILRSLFEVQGFPTGLINYWPFSDGAGSPHIVDVVGPQTISSNPIAWKTGSNPFSPQRPLAYFGGGTRLNCPNALGFPDNYDQITIEAWVNLSNSQTAQKIIAMSIDGNDTYGYSMGLGSGQIYFEILNDNIHLGTGSVSSNQWTHLAFTAKANGTANGYVNGVKQSSASLSQGLPQTSNSNPLVIAIGADSWDGGDYVTGYISELRLWDVQLSDKQILELYQNPVPNRGLSLVSMRQYIDQSISLLTASVSPLATARPVGNQPGWFIFDNTDEVFLVSPLQAGLPALTEIMTCNVSTPGLVKLSFDDSDPINTTGLQMSFVRLSSHGFLALSRLLLSGGVRALLSLPAQHAPELAFSRFDPNLNVINDTVSSSIEFDGAYGEYYWEIFFFMPLLAGNSFNSRQQFTYAKKWYEFIFNPTETTPAEYERQSLARLTAEPHGERPRGLVGYWPLDGTLNDAAGDITLTADGTTSWTQSTLPTGETRQVLDLNGGYVSCVNNPALKITGNQTIEMWLRPTASQSNNPWAISYNAEGDLRIDKGTDQMTLFYRYGRAGSSELNTGLTEGTDYWEYAIATAPLGSMENEWVHIAVVRDVAHNQIRGYVNGQQVFAQTVDFQTQPTSSSTDGMTLGYGVNGYFQGQLANVALWQVARTPDEISASYAGRGRLRQKRFWRFVPFRQLQRQSLYQNLTDPTQLLIYEYDPFDPDAIAHQRVGAYEKAVVMKYINNLINYGDYLFTQDTWETLTEATMYYVLAGDLLGKPPKVIVSDRNQATANYQELADADAGAPPFLIDLEPQVDGLGIAANAPPQVQDLLQNWQTLYDAYFKVPGNRQLFNYYKTIADRIYKIRNGLNIEGQPVEPPLFEPPIDPETMVTGGAQSWAGNGSASPVALAAAIPAYRFSYLIEQAKSLASETVSLGSALLAALEKQDAEQLALMQATQQNNIFNLTTQIKQSQIDQLQAVNDSLQASLASAQLQQSTYQEWLAGGLSAWEIGAESLLVAAMVLEVIASISEGLSAVAFLTLPDNLQLADKVGNAFKATSAGLALLANLSVQSSQILGMQGEFDRRSDDWNLQMQLAANSVNQINAQLRANQYELGAAEQDLSLNQTNIEQSQQIIDFLNSKFTNQELYQWMAGQLSTLYYQSYQLACQLALSAQVAYQYEMCSDDSFINTNAWNSQYQGLLAGESLLANLDQMEQAYLNNNKRKLEITKTISLMKLDPKALLTLKHSGQCAFSLSELLFDLDYPGHYQRTIETLSISIPAVVGPYQNVHATLTQLSNSLVTKPNLEGVKYLLGLTSAPNSSVRMNWNPSQEVALSSGIDDSGLFQLNFNDERYLPFEGTGAVSGWQLSMPKASNPINFESISDVIITLRYSAYDGGQTFAQSVIDLNNGQGYYPLKDYKGYKYLSLKQVYGNAWHAFLNGYEGEYRLDFVLASEMFPVNLDGITLGQGDDEQIFLAPIFAPSILDSIADDMPAITLNDNLWSKGLVEAASQSSEGVSPAGSSLFPLSWCIKASFSAGSPLLRPDGHINPAFWQDIVLIIPYSGSLDWGSGFA